MRPSARTQDRESPECSERDDSENGLPAPRFSSVPAEFVAVLDRFGLLNPETRDWLDSLDNRVRTPIGDNAGADPSPGSVTVDELRRNWRSTPSMPRTRSMNPRVRTGEVRARHVSPHQDHRRARRSVDRGTCDRRSSHRRRHHDRADLSVAVERTPGTLRPHLRNLIARGVVVATAPPTSRRRAYRLAGT